MIEGRMMKRQHELREMISIRTEGCELGDSRITNLEGSPNQEELLLDEAAITVN